MRWLLLTAWLVTGCLSTTKAQLNVELLHQLVDESQSEYARQREARNRQGLNLANEGLNKNQLGRLKDRYRQLQHRFKALGLVMDAAQMGLEAGPIVAQIVNQQRLIFEQAYRNPLLLTIAYDAERELSGKAIKLMNFLYGLALSVGDINQMKASDRRMLFGYVISELRNISGASRGLAVTMSYSFQRQSLNPFEDFINSDKELVEEVLLNSRILKEQW